VGVELVADGPVCVAETVGATLVGGYAATGRYIARGTSEGSQGAGRRRHSRCWTAHPSTQGWDASGIDNHLACARLPTASLRVALCRSA
jgi:hypothetical protein